MFLALAPLSLISEEFVGVIINTKTLKNNLICYTKHEPMLKRNELKQLTDLTVSKLLFGFANVISCSFGCCGV